MTVKLIRLVGVASLAALFVAAGVMVVREIGDFESTPTPGVLATIPPTNVPSTITPTDVPSTITPTDVPPTIAPTDVPPTIAPTDVPPTMPPLAPGLPPDPGEPGKATLQGIDSDNDGVRDDVQIAIFQRYPDDAVKQETLDQSMRALQESIVAGSAEDIDGIFQAANLVLRAVDCIHETMDDSSAEISFIEDALVNTPERTAAYIRFNEALDGQFFGSSDSENPCE